jgi:cobalt/nickel transport system permease protein
MIAATSHLKAATESLLGHWHVRFKLPGLLVLIFSFASVRGLILLPFLPLMALVIWYLSDLPPAYLLTRMRLPGIFLLFMAVILPFWSGQTILLQLGPLALRQEGLLDLLIIVIKFISILAVVVALFATTPLSAITAALKAMGIPWLLTDMLLFTYRYIFQLSGDLKQLRAAARLRGFHGASLGALKPLANITGTMLVRSHEQSERVAQAMALRGYGSSSQVLPVVRPCSSDYYLLIAVLIAAGFLFTTQYAIL